MIYSNDELHGGNFLEVIKEKLPLSGNVAIASGYVSDNVITKFKDDFYRIVEEGGKFKLLVGMAFHEGLPAKKLKNLQEIDSKLRSISSDCGIYVCHSRRFHGKIYRFQKESDLNIYIGSSNFSSSGLSENLECTAEINDDDTKSKLTNYIDYIFHQNNSVSIKNADITVLGSEEYKKRIAITRLNDLARYDPTTVNKTTLEFFEYPLTRAASSEKSNLNAYFGKGRWSRATGKIKPRNWYEVELIAPTTISRLPLYPKGEFLAYTSDGYIMPMKTSGANYKNIRSTPKLTVLGEWIKAKLQDAGVLAPLTPITSETLGKFGKDTLRFYKIEESKYYIEWL